MSIIEVEQVTKSYDGRRVLDEVSLTVERGEIFGILGPNGAGKTTLVESIGGLRTPDSGRITVLDLDPVADGAELKARLGAQLQESRLPDKIRVWEALDLFSSFYDDPAPWRDLLDRLGLGEKADTRFADLSGGQKQRLSVALALVGRPEIAVLDELTTGLDPRARRDTWELIEQIRNDGVTIVLVTHFMEEADRLCDRIAVIDSGRVVAVDTPTGLVTDASSGLRLRFRPSRPFTDDVLTGLAEVDTIERIGDDEVVVTGTGNLLDAVALTLAGTGVVALELRIHRPSLDDAFLALTGREPEEPDVIQEKT